MERVKIIRKGNGEAYLDKRGRFVFVKEGVHFALSKAQMTQLTELIDGLTDGSLTTIDPTSPDMARGD